MQQAGLIDAGKPLHHLNSLSHAEAMALMDASGSILASNRKVVTIYVDRPTCDWCINDGGLIALKKFLGLDELVVFDSLGTGVRINVEDVMRSFEWRPGHMLPH